MFKHEGAHRTNDHNQLLAGYLAVVAGLVNSIGFILIGSFTSHVTGNVGRMADDVALGHASAAALAAAMIVSFYLGAFVASMALESNVLRARPTVYGLLLLGESVLIAAFLGLASVWDDASPRFRDAQALLLCSAMGLQNSLVTRLSGAVVRTTHLTGVLTDLGIEGARWFRYWRSHFSKKTGLPLVMGSHPPDRPHAPKVHLLLTIFVSFVVGSAAGALLAVRFGQPAVLVPVVLLVFGGMMALGVRVPLVGEDSRR